MDRCDQFIAGLTGQPLKKALNAKKDIIVFFRKTTLQMKKRKVRKNNDFVEAFGAFKNLLRGDMFLSNSDVSMRINQFIQFSLMMMEKKFFAAFHLT